MTLPPAKRQRRLIVSDDSESALPTRRAPPRVSKELKAAVPDRKSVNHGASPEKLKTRPAANANPKSPPEKAGKRGNKEEKETRTLHTFFGRATEEQRWASKDKTPPTTIDDVEAEDAIEDDSFDEALVELAVGKGDANNVLDRRKDSQLTVRHATSNSARNLVTSSQKFARPLKPAIEELKAVPRHHDNASNWPWAERLAPTSLEELAVHRKKVADVQLWLNAVFQGRDRRRLLILKGPAGSGKTTTISLLSKAMKFDVSEWRSPAVADTGITSFSFQFDEFLNRGSIFGALEFSGSPSHSKKNSASMQENGPRKILLVEEFPSTMTLSSSAVTSFRNILLQYLAVAVPPHSPAFDQSNLHLASHPPIVLIVSESLLTSATASTDSFTAHRLLGPDICNHPYATVLEFNPVAPTLLFKALELAIRKEARISRRRRIPGPAVLKRLSELGDVRSAVNGLEFLCLRGDVESDWGGRIAANTKKSDKGSSSLTKLEKESLELVTQREATLGIFHAAGKVVWNKRQDPQIAGLKTEPPPNPPEHMLAFHRCQASQVDVEELLNEIGTDIQTFTAALHENYALSTNGSQFTGSSSDCIDFLSESDLLSPGGRHMGRSSRSNPGSQGPVTQAGGVDMLRQNEIGFQVAVRGLLFSLPIPVTRAAHPSGRKGDSFKMFYPTSLKMWRLSEEIHDLVSLEMSSLLAPQTDRVGSMPDTSRAEGVESWKSRSFYFQSAVGHDTHLDEAVLRVWATRDELLLDRLPYMAKMRLGNDASTRVIKKITQLNGSLVLNSGDDEANDTSMEGIVDLSAADETTDRVASPQKWAGSVWQRLPLTGASSVDPVNEVPVEKLYISEDDIEDD